MRDGPVDLDSLRQKVPPQASDMVTPVTIVKPTPHPAVPQMVMLADDRRLRSDHHTVTVRNTSHNQAHIIVDRHMNCHELRPGESKQVDMLDDEVAAFRELGRPNRGVYSSGHLAGMPLPAHPLQFPEMPLPESARIDDGGGGDSGPPSAPGKINRSGRG
jgi:hypothetical protein